MSRWLPSRMVETAPHRLRALMIAHLKNMPSATPSTRSCGAGSADASRAALRRGAAARRDIEEEFMLGVRGFVRASAGGGR